MVPTVTSAWKMLIPRLQPHLTLNVAEFAKLQVLVLGMAIATAMGYALAILNGMETRRSLITSPLLRV
jgi:ABC-type nitrate/sulfonate/bicarbonate transport system permease component